MHMYKILCVYIFIGAAASFSSSFLPYFCFFFSLVTILFCFWFRLQTSMQPPLERGEKEKISKTANRIFGYFSRERDSKRAGGKMASRDVDADVRCVVVVRAIFPEREKKKRTNAIESRKARARRRSRAAS